MAGKTPLVDQSTIIIISGDADIRPAVSKIAEKNRVNNWKVEIYMWEQGFSSRLLQMQTEYPEVVSCEYLDKYMDKITYTSRKYTKKVTANNSVILTIAADAFPPEVEVKIFDNGWWKRLDDIVKRPARGVG